MAHLETTLENQISELEDLYAESLMQNADRRDLHGIWLLIKYLRLELPKEDSNPTFPVRATPSAASQH